MKKFALICVLILTICGFSIAYAKEDNCMIPPKPLDNPMLDSMIGTWKGKNDMMGNKMIETLKISWSLNHQFLLMELKSQAVNDSNYRYEGLGLFGIDQRGQVKTWWFDSWGASTVSTGIGSIKHNKMAIKDGNADFKEERSFMITGDTLVMHAKGTMNRQGAAKSFEQDGVYKRL